MRVVILGEWFDTLRTLPCFELAGQDVTVFTDHVEDTEALARRLVEATVPTGGADHDPAP